jgi:hypothetical protein
MKGVSLNAPKVFMKRSEGCTSWLCNNTDQTPPKADVRLAHSRFLPQMGKTLFSVSSGPPG